MSQRRKNLRARAGRPHPAPSSHLPAASSVMLPLGAMLLASSFGALAQTAPASEDKQLPTVVVREKALAPEGKDALQATETTIGKGKQQLRDIPQSVTVVTERLIDDRNLDTVKEALKNTAGITFLAAEGGEEDIRLRGFALQATGDLFIDGMRDPAIYDRDTFAMDRMEVLRGSASMLFGRGSTGGAVNQVSKTPRLIDEHQVDLTLGNHKYVRATGDFNIKTGDSSALRLNAMATKADNNGSGASLDKRGMAVAYRTGIGERDEFLASPTTWTTTTASTTACRSSHQPKAQPTACCCRSTPTPTTVWPATTTTPAPPSPAWPTPTASAATASSRPRCAWASSTATCARARSACARRA
jgi:catecholate siderophore receptor